MSSSTSIISLLALAFSSVVASAQLPAPPAGFVWQLESSSTYTANDTFSATLDGTQSLAPAAPPVVSSLAETLSLTTFDADAAETTLETDNPGMDFEIVVLSSDYAASLSASASTQIFNFDTAFAAHDYSGTTSVSNFQITGAATAGPTSDALVNPMFNVGGFLIGDFEDASTTDTTASVSLSDTGVAPTSGAVMNFSYGGSSILALFSDDPAAANQLALMSSSAFGAASITTDYEVYKLVPIPEPSSALLAMLGAALALRRRR